MNSSSQVNTNEPKKVREINLKEIFEVIKRRYLVLVVVMAIAGIFGYLQSTSSSALKYQTSSRIIIGADAESRKTLQVIIKDSTILSKVINELNLNKSPEELANQITVSSVEGTQVISISIVDTDPVRAAKIADTTARVFRDEVPNIIGEDYVRLLSNAKVNQIPIDQNQNNKVIVVLIIGLVFGIVLIFLLDSLDDTIRTEVEIETFIGMPILGRVSKITSKNIKEKK